MRTAVMDGLARPLVVRDLRMAETGPHDVERTRVARSVIAYD